ncbi:hydroxyacid dehydrogenase [Bordetella genomosp. 10]|uniref:Hydroxyacid dehydrogenase n=1 Tax=Bordetella genomosp. 10 TaxID=1416804 RepID=A0A261SJS3_9BORD|nr:2-hydroxyacid dehydrogenase [Bordetella genomosp. 10]OZI37656.1 hydroxyacid dehydrogenase [Bordetella genomosp. 10]
MKHRLLQQTRLIPQADTALRERYDVHPLWEEADADAFLARHGGEFAGLVTTSRLGASDALMGKLPNLRVISNFGVGLDAMDVAAARRRGIAVGYTPEVLNDCVADTAFALLMDVSRGVSAADRYVRRGEWLRAPYPLTHRVSGKRLGIFGLGRIGRVIARRAQGFDMEIRYHNRRPAADLPYAYENSLIDLARWADYLVIASTGGAETRHIVSAEVLDALGPQGFLINISRGGNIDEAALVRALQEKRIAGAGLDVFEQEPRVPEAFFALDNVVLLPHVASATHETRADMAQLVLDNLEAFFRTGAVKVSAL